MAKERNPNWKYYKSEFADEEFAIHKETGWIFFANGAKYSPAEIKILADSGTQLDRGTHNVKTIIGGELVAYERKGTDDKGKSVKSGGRNGKPNDPDSGSKIQEVTGNGENAESELFDIY